MIYHLSTGFKSAAFKTLLNRYAIHSATLSCFFRFHPTNPDFLKKILDFSMRGSTFTKGTSTHERNAPRK